MRDGRIKIEKKGQMTRTLLMVKKRKEELKFFLGIKSVFKSSLTFKKTWKKLSV